MAFECRIPVRFGDIDYAKIVYYPRHLHFCHVAMEEMFENLIGIPYHEAITVEKVGYPTVKLDAEYVKPVGFGETVEMSVTVERIGNRSVDFHFEGRRASDGELAFRVRSRAVATHMEDWHSVPVPEIHRRGFERVLRA
jgi:4-hydroxybenzoyl-CoA thioesterase